MTSLRHPEPEELHRTSRQRAAVSRGSNVVPMRSNVFATPVRTKENGSFPRAITTIAEALDAIRCLPLEAQATRRWQRLVKTLTYAVETMPDDVELTHMASTELRAALLAVGWL